MNENLERMRIFMPNLKKFYILSVCCLFSSFAISAHGRPEALQRQPLAYADVADLVTGAPIVADAVIANVQKVKVGVGEDGKVGTDYLLVTAQVRAVIRGQNGVAPSVSLLVNPASINGKLRRKDRVFLFAEPTAKATQIRLVSRNAIQIWNLDLEKTVREITADVLASDSPPAIIGVGDAFHVAGTIAGEGETQIFLRTANNAPVSLSIVRRPGQPPHWGVALGEIVDEASVPPQKGTLLWYRLACALPDQLPATSLRALETLDAQAAIADYAFVRESLGSCGRTL
jgi:hypothetical protein